MLSALSLTAVAQQKKTVAVLDPICRDNSVNTFYQQVVRGSMESAVTVTDEFISFDRTAFDKVLDEHKFEQSGVVNDAQIRRMGIYAGVDFVLITEVSAYDGYMSVLVKILNIETGEASKGLSELMELTPPIVQESCKELAKKLFGIVDVVSGTRKGTLHLPEGRYEGEIKNGKPHGNGKILYNRDNEKDRVSYEGAWENGLPSGQGTMIWKDGDKYIGGWLKGVRSGMGTYYFIQGVILEGTSVNGKWNGKVVLSQDGDRLEITAKDNDFLNGHGTYYYKDGRKYVGNFVNGKKQGAGTLYAADGETRYEGNFENDMQEGEGIVYLPNGVLKGHWEKGALSGFTQIYFDDGSEEYGHYKTGKREGEWTKRTSSRKYLKGWFSGDVQTTYYH